MYTSLEDTTKIIIEIIIIICVGEQVVLPEVMIVFEVAIMIRAVAIVMIVFEVALMVRAVALVMIVWFYKVFV